MQYLRQIDALARLGRGFVGFQSVHAPDHFIDGPETKLRHDLAHFFGDKPHEIDDALRVARKLFPEPWILRGHADRACI